MKTLCLDFPCKVSLKERCIIFLIFLFCLAAFPSSAQVNLPTEKWQSDLRFLQQTVNDQYPFLFKKVTKEKFDEEVEKLYVAIPKLQEHEIIVGFARIVALFQYGHSSIGLSGWWEREPFRFHQMPYNLYHFNDGVFIQGVHQDYKKALGAKVIKVEGMPVEEALAAVRPAFPTENDQFFKAYGMGFLGVPEILHAQRVTKTLKKTVTLTLEKSGQTFEQTFSVFETKGFPGDYGFIKEDGVWLDAREKGNDPLYLKNLARIYYFEYLPEKKTVYVRHSQIQDDPAEAIPAFYERLFNFIDDNDVERLILDVRLNGGGNNYKNKPIVTGIIRSEKINKPGNLFVIIGRKTFSACQNLVNELDNYTEAIFVGEPTGENINFYGDNRRVELPSSKIPIYLSFAWWQDKPQWEGGPWTAPHFAVDMSFEEYRTNQDPVVKAALSFNDDNFILDPMAYLTDLYQTGQSEKLQSESVRMISDPNYKFFDFEDEFNQLGYELMNKGDVNTAFSVFGFVVQLFPDSANAWDSFAEVHWKSGQTEKAIELYNKAILMDPDGVVGANARNMLEQIKNGK